MLRTKILLTAATAAALLLGTAVPASAAPDPVLLGTAEGFAVLAATTVTNTGPSVISGDIGLSPGTAVVGFPPGLQTAGATYVAEGVALQAKADTLAAYGVAGNPGPTNATGVELGGQTLQPGLYVSSGVLQLTGNLTLDDTGNPGGIFVFRSLSTLTTATNSSITLTGGVTACDVYWIVPTSATLGTTSDFVGTIIANQSITATTGADIVGRLLALNGAVTLDTNTVTSTGCAPVTTNPGSGITALDAAALTASETAAAQAAAASAAEAAAAAAAAALLLAATGPEHVPALSLGGLAIVSAGILLVVLARRRRAIVWSA